MWVLCGLAAEKSAVIVSINGSKYYIHTVQAGDTLFGLAKTYEVAEQAILQSNPAVAQGLQAGSTLKIPFVPDVVGRPSEKRLRKTFDTHRVAQGETLYAISRQYEIPIPTIIAIVVAVVAVLAVILSGYVKAPPDQAYIISGLKKESKVLIGRAGIRVPIFERLDKLYLGQMTVDIKTEQSVPTSDFINVNVDAVAKVRISPHAEGIKLAAKNFLNKRPEEITRDLQDSLQGNMREIIGTLSLKEINTDRDSCRVSSLNHD